MRRRVTRLPVPPTVTGQRSGWRGGAVRRCFHQPGAGSQARRRFGNTRAAIDRLAEFPCRYPMGDHPGRREAVLRGPPGYLFCRPDAGSNATAGDVMVPVRAGAVARPSPRGHHTVAQNPENRKLAPIHT